MNGFEIIKKLGNGSFSSVYKVRRKLDNNIYALKKVKLLKLNEKRKDKNKNKISNKSRNKSRNEEIINKLKKIDLNMEEKKFEMIFNTPFKDYLLAFVNDEEEFIIKEGQNSISFKFKTFKDCFDDDKNANNNKKKEKFKKYIIRKLNRNVKEEKK